MTAITKAHQRILALMDAEFFTPVLEQTGTDDVAPHLRPQLAELQARLRREREQLDGAGSAEAAIQRLEQLVHSEGVEIDAKLGEFGRPSIGKLMNHVEFLADELSLSWRKQ